MRILVTGSRHWRDAEAIFDVLSGLALVPGSHTLVHGDADGADTLAAHAASVLGMIVEAHPADWKRNGRAAGPMRNSEMVKAGADLCIAFPLDTSIGTWDCIRKAFRAGIPVRIYPPKR